MFGNAQPKSMKRRDAEKFHSHEDRAEHVLKVLKSPESTGNP